MPPLIHARRQAHGKVLVVPLAVLELGLGKAMETVGFVLVEAGQKPLFLFGEVVKFSEGVGEVEAAASVGEEVVDVLEDFAGEFGLVVGEHVFDEGPLEFCVRGRETFDVLVGETSIGKGGVV